MLSSLIILIKGAGTGVITRFMEKNNGRDNKIDRVQIITNDIMADDTFWGVRLLAE